MLIIGLGYEKRVGKDSLADHIIAQRGKSLSIRRFAYADSLKEEVNAAFSEMFPNSVNPGCDSEPVLRGKWTTLCRWYRIPLAAPVTVDFGEPLCPYGKCREVLQWWGTEYRRVQFSDSYWLDRIEDKLMRASLDGIKVVLIPDMRFPNEAEQIEQAREWGAAYGHALAGRSWHLIRLNADGTPFVRTDSHISERSLDGHNFNATITGRTIEETLEAGLHEFDSLIGEYFATSRNRLRNDRPLAGE